MGYHFNHHDEPIYMAVPKPMLTKFGIHYRLESCDNWNFYLHLMVLFLALNSFHYLLEKKACAADVCDWINIHLIERHLTSRIGTSIAADTSMGLASAAKKFLGAWRLESNRVFRLLCTSNPALSGRTNNNEAKSKSYPLCNLQIKYKLHSG